MKIIEGPHDAGDSKFAIVVSRWNELVTGKLLDGAVETLKENGAADDNITVVHVPGSFEIPFTADFLAKSGEYEAVICLGAVVQGETDHHDYINHAVASGIVTSSQEAGIPIIFGVLTTKNMQQALERAGGKVGNKGSEAAITALEMVGVVSEFIRSIHGEP